MQVEVNAGRRTRDWVRKIGAINSLGGASRKNVFEELMLELKSRE